MGENFRTNFGGTLAAGYGGSFVDQGPTGRGLDLSGQGTLTGYYYNPNFISFNVQPYYNRSQNNSDFASIYSGKGVTSTANIFSGSHFPGSITFNKFYNSTGQYGIPGIAGLTTNGDSQSFGINWSALVPKFPTLSLGYAQNSGSSTLLGSTAQNESSGRSWSARSTYTIVGFSLGGGFYHQTNDSSFPAVFENSEATRATSSTNSYQFFAGHKVPLNGYLSTQFTRSDYNSEITSGGSSGTTDTASANLNLVIKKLPISVSANYTDNLLGSLQEDILSNGGTLLLARRSPVSRAFTVSAMTSYTVWKVGLSAYVNRVQQSSGLNHYGATQFGGNVSYSFARRWLSGLTISAGLVDTANQEGNLWTGMMGSVNYIRRLRGWEVAGNLSYDQSTQTLLNIYTTSSLRYGANLRRRLQPRMTWSAGFSGAHSALVRLSGNSTRSENFHSTFFWRRYSVSGFYSQSNGASVLTTNGLVALPVPEPLIPSSNLIFYDGRSQGFSASATPIRELTITTGYSQSRNGSVASVLSSRNGTDMLNGRAIYRFRKLYFNAGFTRFEQSISSSATGPATITSYYFGLSRWFNFF